MKKKVFALLSLVMLALAFVTPTTVQATKWKFKKQIETAQPNGLIVYTCIYECERQFLSTDGCKVGDQVERYC